MKKKLTFCNYGIVRPGSLLFFSEFARGIEPNSIIPQTILTVVLGLGVPVSALLFETQQTFDMDRGPISPVLKIWHMLSESLVIHSGLTPPALIGAMLLWRPVLNCRDFCFLSDMSIIFFRIDSIIDIFSAMELLSHILPITIISQVSTTLDLVATNAAKIICNWNLAFLHLSQCSTFSHPWSLRPTIYS